MQKIKIHAGPHLDQIKYPADLRKFAESDLVKISQELRQYIIDTVSVYGGHFGASLGNF